jgi:molecular chaperone GrpE
MSGAEPAMNPEMPEEPQAPEAAAANDDAAKAIAALQALVAEKEEAASAAKDQALRTLAEMENLRKRTEREMQDTSKYAITGFARDLVSVLENLQRATQSISDEQKANDPTLANLAIGVEMTQKELLSAFEKHGIRRIDPLGEKFDHNFHQAVAQIPSPDAPEGTIVQVLQAGYVIHDRLLRPAMVGVATAGQNQVNTTV